MPAVPLRTKHAAIFMMMPAATLMMKHVAAGTTRRAAPPVMTTDTTHRHCPAVRCRPACAVMAVGMVLGMVAAMMAATRGVMLPAAPGATTAGLPARPMLPPRVTGKARMTATMHAVASARPSPTAMPAGRTSTMPPATTWRM